MELDFSGVTADKTREWFSQRINCAQIAFAHGAYYLGFDIEDALKIASTFGGGMRCGGMCGAAIGALMAIGLKYGNSEPNDVEQVEILRAKQALYKEKFIEMHKHLNCVDLLGGLNYGNPDDRAQIMSSGITGTLCPQIVANACNILDEVLDND